MGQSNAARDKLYDLCVPISRQPHLSFSKRSSPRLPAFLGQEQTSKACRVYQTLTYGATSEQARMPDVWAQRQGVRPCW
eukprot:714610-Rhodomonas_salina.2